MRIHILDSGSASILLAFLTIKKENLILCKKEEFLSFVKDS
jgi:hypothetical protein